MHTTNSQLGQITVLMIFILTILLSASVSLVFLVTRWNDKVTIQLHLDQCVSEVTRELETLQNYLETSNKRITSLRTAIVVAVDPRIQTSLKLWLKSERAAQDIRLFRWKTRQVSWLVQGGCNSETKLPSPLPPLSWNRPPNDAIGEQPLEWKGSRNEDELKIALFKKPRTSVSKVRFRQGQWTASWSGPL